MSSRRKLQPGGQPYTAPSIGIIRATGTTVPWLID